MTSPCTTCATLADCSRCDVFDDFLAALDAPAAECLTCADIAHLLDAGEHLPTIAARMGLTPKSLDQHARRHHLFIPNHRRVYADAYNS